MAISHDLLLKRLSRGDEKAFDQIYHLYVGRLKAFLHKIKLTHALEDVVQDTFITLWKKRADIDSSKSFDGYLFTIAKNHAIKALNDKIRVDLIERENGGDWIEEEDERSRTYKNKRLELLRDSIEKLPKRPKQILILKRYEGLTIEEIALRLGISKSTVENHINRAMAELKKEVSGKSLLITFLAYFFT